MPTNSNPSIRASGSSPPLPLPRNNDLDAAVAAVVVLSLPSPPLLPQNVDVIPPLLVPHVFHPWPNPPAVGWLSASLLLQAFVPFARLAVLFPSWSLSIECVYYTIAPTLLRVPKVAPLCLALLSFGFCLYRPSLSALYIGSDTYGISLLALAWAWLSGWLLYVKANRFLTVLLIGAIGAVAIWADNLLAGWFNYFAWLGTALICAFAHGPLFSRTWKRLGNYLG
jgi:peptidoglycan/LPS O-acetylase OafA/YrhL